MSTQGHVQGAVSPEHILQVGLGFWGSRTSAERRGTGPLHRAGGQAGHRRRAAHAARRCIPRSARDFFDALVALGFLERTDGIYTNTPAARLFLDRNKPSYVGGILEMCSRRLYGFWNGLTDGSRTGQPQNEVKTAVRRCSRRCTPIRRGWRRSCRR